MSEIGFIGLGNMGGPMAANLVRAGHRVRGFDLSAQAREVAAENGVEITEAAVGVCDGVDIVITMLPSGSHVLDCYEGADGLLKAAPEGTLFIDTSTIAVTEARAARDAATRAGHNAVDAPVSGGVVGASSGTLTFMVGGSTSEFERAELILSAMGKKAIHCGESGAGQATKICNNLMLAVSMIGVSEAFMLGEALGLSHQALFDVASTATGQCWALTTNCPVPGPVPTSPANKDYAPGFATALMVKDLGLAQRTAGQYEVNTPLAQHAYKLYTAFSEHGGSGLDFSGVIKFLRDRGVTPGIGESAS